MMKIMKNFGFQMSSVFWKNVAWFSKNCW